MINVALPDAFQFLFEPARHKGAYGGRGSAKSHSFASALLVLGGMHKLRILCAREVQKSIRESVKRLLDKKIAEHNLGSYYQSLDTEIRGYNGTSIIFAGLRNPDALPSLEDVDIAWLEEANRVGQRALDLLIPTIRNEDNPAMPQGSEIWYTWNPDLPTDPVDNFLRGPNCPPTAIVKEVNYEDNPFFPNVLQKELDWDKQRDQDKFLHVWKGGYRISSEARVFKNWRVDEFDDPPEGTEIHYGADWGYSVDPTVLVRCWFKGRTMYVDYEAYAIGCDLDYIPALFAGDGAKWSNPMEWEGVPGATKWPIIADSARPETIAHVNRFGFKIRSAKKGAGSVEDGISFLKNYDIIVHPRCKHVIDELTYYNWKTDPQTGLILPILEDKKNHTIDSFRYAVEGKRRSTGKLPGPGSLTRSSPNKV